MSFSILIFSVSIQALRSSAAFHLSERSSRTIFALRTILPDSISGERLLVGVISPVADDRVLASFPVASMIIELNVAGTASPRASAVMNFGLGGALGIGVLVDDLIFLFSTCFLGLSSFALATPSPAFVLSTCAWIGFTIPCPDA